MPAGPQLIEAVASVLQYDAGRMPGDIQHFLAGRYSTRAIRYAITELIKAGRATRKGQQGPVYAVEAK